MDARLPIDREICFCWHEIRRGSAEHYWHFMFGYFLPLMHLLLRQGASPPTRIALWDCGPMMNRILVEALAQLRIEPRFDKTLCAITQGRVGNSVVLERWDMRMNTGRDLYALKRLLLEARNDVAALLAPWSCCNRPAGGQILILQRSPESSFYQNGGGARIQKYGTGRRSFEGLGEGQQQLKALGIPSVIYEPGAHTLACQINYFAAAAGVIGVRGAEFANTLWAPAGAKIIMFLSSSLTDAEPPQKALAHLLDHIYCEIPHEGAVSPQLDVSRVAHHLQH